MSEIAFLQPHINELMFQMNLCKRIRNGMLQILLYIAYCVLNK